jgi:DNA-binding GntR family transcriptional regulator
MLASLTKSEAVYRETRWRILTGALPPSTAINQADLALQFGVSPTPVREALRRLESEGLVTFVAHAMVLVSALDLREFDDLYAIRVRLDPFAGQLAALNRTPDDIALLEELLHPHPPADGQVHDRFETNRKFHRAVYSASGNRQLTAMLDQLWDRTERYRVILVANESDDGAKSLLRRHSDEDHEAIASALITGDAGRVEALLQGHVQRSHDAIRAILEESMPQMAARPLQR